MCYNFDWAFSELDCDTPLAYTKLETYIDMINDEQGFTYNWAESQEHN